MSDNIQSRSAKEIYEKGHQVSVDELRRISHTFNNLLHGITGSLKFIEEEGYLKGDGQMYLANAVACSERAARLVSRLEKVASDKESRAVGGLRRVPDPDISSRKTVLVIDDEEVVQEVCRAVLERAGYLVLTASSGASGIELYERHKSEIYAVVLDLSMPYMKGNLVFARLKAIEPAVQVILMSGYSNEQVLRQFNCVGMAGFLRKPFTAVALTDLLSSIVPNSQRHAAMG